MIKRCYKVKELFDTRFIGEYPHAQIVEGFFNTLWILDTVLETYTDEQGNPISIWGQKDITVNTLDFNYLSRSGEKILRRFISSRIVYDEPELLPEGDYFEEEKKIVEYITRKYSKKWLDLWETMFYEYEPLWNYDMKEVLKDEITEYEHGKVNTRSGSVTNTPGTTYTETQSIKGYDSDNWGETDKSVSQPSGLGDVTTYNSMADTASGTDTQTKNYELTRTGNIGVTTSMELIQKQRQVVTFNYFDQIVFPDIDNELTLKIY